MCASWQNSSGSRTTRVLLLHKTATRTRSQRPASRCDRDVGAACLTTRRRQQHATSKLHGAAEHLGDVKSTCARLHAFVRIFAVYILFIYIACSKKIVCKMRAIRFCSSERMLCCLHHFIRHYNTTRQTDKYEHRVPRRTRSLSVKSNLHAHDMDGSWAKHRHYIQTTTPTTNYILINS